MSVVFGRHAESGDYTLTAEVVLSYPIESVFQFFSDSRNLQILTPPWLDFTILDSEPERMFVGKLIDYRIKIHGVPIPWRSEISVWEPPRVFPDDSIAAAFVDVQRRGPYRKWHHTHRFEALRESTRMTDFVRYRLIAGFLAHPIFVRPELNRIFSYRLESLKRVFPDTASHPAS